MSESKQNSQTTVSSSKSRHFPQYLACGILCLGGFIGGNVTGWSSTALPSLESSCHFTLSSSDLSWIASVVNLGGVLSAATAGYLMRKMGRKGILLCSALPYIIGWTLLSFPLNIMMLCVGRVFVGLGLGWMAISTSVYLSEIAEPDLRGKLSVIWFVAVRIGILFEYGVGSILRYDHLSSISAILSVAYGMSIFLIPESPRWLMTQWRIQNAVDSLCWLRACEKSSPSPKILAEIEEIKEAVVRAEKNADGLTISDFFTHKVVLKSLMIASTLMFFREACGGNVFSYFTVQIFEKTGSALESHISGVVVGVAQIVALFITTYYVDKVGRRKLLIIALSIMSFSLLWFGVFYRLRPIMEAALDQYFGWFPLITFVIYHAANSGGPFALTYTVTSEVVPTNIIGSVSSFIMILTWMTSFLLARFYEDMNVSFGVANTFWIYAGLCGLGATCVHLLVPETTGRSLENIHMNHESNKMEVEDTV